MTATAPSTVHRCRRCARRVAAWLFTCPSCGARNEMVRDDSGLALVPRPPPPPFPQRWGPPRGGGLDAFELDLSRAREEREGDGDDDDGRGGSKPLCTVQRRDPERILTGIAHLDRALGKPGRLGRRPDRLGLAMTSSNVLAGVKGVGKSRLGLEALARIAAGDAGAVRRCGVASGEMPEELFADYADDMRLFERFPAARPNLLVHELDDFDDVVAWIDEEEIDVVLVDSVQRMRSRLVEPYRFGADAQVAYGSKLIADRCNLRGPHKGKRPCAAICISHANAKGDVAGKQGPQHDGDGVFNMEHYDPETGKTLTPKHRKGFVRFLTEKNRYGAEPTVAHFRLCDDGFECVDPPEGEE